MHKVIFVGEEGEDTGGLKREFWRLFAVALYWKSNLMIYCNCYIFRLSGQTHSIRTMYNLLLYKPGCLHAVQYH